MSYRHLFVVCMNNSGSTLLHHCLDKCSSVISLPRTVLNEATSSEGQSHVKDYMPLPKQFKCVGIWTEKLHLFNDEKRYDWDKIKEIWLKEWESEMSAIPDGRVLLEKSPPKVMRAGLLQKHFLNSYFIIMVRNPYAVSEGIRRRHGYNIARCAMHWSESMKLQMNNVKNLQNIAWIKYEDLCDNKEFVKDRIIKLIPELSDISLDGQFPGHYSLHGNKTMIIKNLNYDQISNLSKNDITIISDVLLNYKEELNFFKYKILGKDND